MSAEWCMNSQYEFTCTWIVFTKSCLFASSARPLSSCSWSSSLSISSPAWKNSSDNAAVAENKFWTTPRCCVSCSMVELGGVGMILARHWQSNPCEHITMISQRLCLSLSHQDPRSEIESPGLEQRLKLRGFGPESESPGPVIGWHIVTQPVCDQCHYWFELYFIPTGPQHWIVQLPCTLFSYKFWIGMWSDIDAISSIELVEQMLQKILHQMR